MIGTGRSGSTLLERALGESPGVAALGETVHLWERGVGGHELCGCGEPFDRCAFWSETGQRAYGGWETLDLDTIVTSRHRVIRSRRIPELLGASPDQRFRQDRGHLLDVLERMYRGARDASGAGLLVDSSKLPAYAALLRSARVDVRALFVVRDPRGVAYSWAKSVERPEIVGERVLMPQYGAARSATNWTTYAGIAALLRVTGVPMLTVRYEDFLNTPADAIGRILDFAGHPLDGALRHVDGRTLHLRSAHTVAGNPMRFATGDVELVPDDAWRSNLPVKDRRAVEALTVGARRVLGYR